MSIDLMGQVLFDRNKPRLREQEPMCLGALCGI
jgi:hypothetical protein